VRCVGAVPSFGTLHGYLCCDGAGDVPATDRSTPVIVAGGVLGCMWCTQTIGSMVVHVESAGVRAATVVAILSLCRGKLALGSRNSVLDP